MANSAEKARALEQCERDLDVAIERLVNLRLDAAADAEQQHDSDGCSADVHDNVHPAAAAEEVGGEEQRTVISAVHVPTDAGSDDPRTDQYWRARAVRFLEDFVGASSVSTATAAACRAERDVALWQNGVLKKAVRVQHRLCKEKEAANRELQRQLAACQERVRSLETDNNYALSMYLRQSQAQAQMQGGSITGCFHPEVF